jgi:hypothetical protein
MTSTITPELVERFYAASPEQVVAIARILYPECAEEPGREAEKSGTGMRRFLFRPAGSHCEVVFNGSQAFHVRNNLGARYLCYLLHHPNQVISAYDLEVAIRPERAGIRSKGSIQQKLGAKTTKEYLREVDRLRRLREEAEERGDSAEVDRVDSEIGAYEEALEGEGVTGDAGERARCNVSKAIAALRRELAAGGAAEKEFCRHIDQFVSLGYECVYNQPEGRVWE